MPYIKQPSIEGFAVLTHSPPIGATQYFEYKFYPTYTQTYPGSCIDEQLALYASLTVTG